MPIAYRIGALLLAGALAGVPAAAETVRSFRVSAVVANGCAVTSVAGSSWGSIDLGTVQGVAGAAAQGSLVSGGVAGLQIDCTPGTTVSIAADAGLNAVGGVRQLASGSARIAYTLYANGSATPWTTQSIALAFPAGTSRQTFPIAARATLASAAKAGAYADTVRITLSW